MSGNNLLHSKRQKTDVFYAAIILLVLALRSSGLTCSQTTGCAPPLENLATGRVINVTSGIQGFQCDNSVHTSGCLNDGDYTTWWSSDYFVSTVVYVTLNFAQSVTVENTSVWFPQFSRLAAFVLERSVDFGRNWTAYRYYSTNCLNTFGKNATSIFSIPRNTTDAICLELPWSTATSSRADFTVQSQLSASADAATIWQYKTVTNLRLKLVTPSPILRDYEILEWVVEGSCMCNGHASTCVPFPGDSNTSLVFSGCLCEHNTAGDHCGECAVGYNSLPWRPGNATSANACQQCNCNNHSVDCAYSDALQSSNCTSCTQNTTGNNCELCLPGFYHDPLLPLSDPNTCKPCGCYPEGTINSTVTCDNTGNCSCKPYVQGPTCTSCQNGYWNLSSAGCQECNCDLNGSLNGSYCDPVTGKCACRALFTGDNCDTCQSGYYMTLMPSPQSNAMCLPCQCNLEGSLSSVCDDLTSQCPCKTGVTGLLCNMPQIGYYVKALDAIIYEAESAELSPGATCCNDPAYYTGTGYVTFASSGAMVQFINVQVPKDDTYMLILRYQYSSVTNIELMITIEPSVPSQTVFARSVPEVILVEINSTGATNGFVIPGVANLYSSVQYTIVVQQETNGTWNLDSIVLMPLAFNTSSSTPLGVDCLPAAASPFALSIECQEVVFILSLAFYNQTFACNCSAANALCNCNPYGGGFCTGLVCCPSGTYSNGSTCLPCGCSAYSNSSQCDLNGQCPCPLGIQGLKCDACSYMHHNLSAGCPACTCDMPDCNCIQCVCSGKSSVCSADLVDYSEAVMTTDFTTLCNIGASPLDCMGGWVFVSETGQPLPSLLSGPGLHYVLLISDDIRLYAPETFLGNQERSLGLDIVLVVGMTSSTLQSQSIRLAGVYRSGALIGTMTLNTSLSTYTIPLKEGYWQWNSTTGPSATITDLIAVLSNLTELSFSAHFTTDIIEQAAIDSMSLFTYIEKNATVPSNVQIIPGVFAVENCVCPKEYTGQFCQLCSNGYARTSRDPTEPCQKCSCNNLTLDCNANTGVCIGCTGNSIGSHCELCLPGYYGDPTAGVPCTACQCNPNGTVGVCDGLSGSCTCKQNVMGPNCDQCKDGYWNFTNIPEGCVPCQCCSNGSVNNSCNKVTGRCTCLPNVGSSQDSNCCSCSYGSFGLNTTTGCQTCNCSAANASCHCNGGSCITTVCCPSGTYSNGSTCLPCGCSAYSNSSQCDLNGQCPCPLGIQGLKCDACSHMHHNLSAGCPACTCDMPDCNCIQCVCSGKSSVCSADLVDYSEAVMTTDFTTLCNIAASPLDCMGGWVFMSETGQPLPSLLSGPGLHYVLLNNDGIRLYAPKTFLGNQERSLGLDIVLVVGMTSTLQSQSIRLVGLHRSVTLIGMMTLNTSLSTYTIPLKEGYWQWNSTTGPSATITDLIAVLSNLTELSFSARFTTAMVEESTIDSVSLFTYIKKNATVPSNVQIIPGVFAVENCVCPKEYTGQFCQLCSNGYARISQDPTEPCQKCNCNNLTLDCDANTAVCIGCTGNTTGPQCNMCQAGYYGDPTKGIPCLPCGCLPLSVNISHTCTLESDGLPTCDWCDVGYTGRRCDQCQNGYYGISTLGRCSPCNCNSNVDPSLGLTCDSTTGVCLNCTNHTTGSHCELCLSGFYGNITAGVPCKACQCNPNGTVGVCDGVSGSCTCKQNVVGPNCDQCKDGYWNLTNIPEGCVPCQCCSNGSVNNSCNKVTGGCTCLPNVGSSQDSNCCSCSYGSFGLNTTTGCQTCNCSSHSLSPQCDLTTGQCPCTQGASGRFCELCSRGYARTSMNSADSCQQCNCNNLTLDCDANTGVCIGCTGNTTGAYCDTCLPGYYGDPTRGIPCLPCGCLPLNVNITHTCTLESDGLPTCDWCDVGYTGRRCDQCQNGYYGISTLGRCSPCNCNSNVDPSLGLTCDSTTGVCLNCTNHTTGSHCELCLPGFYGNITAGVPCKACQCNPNGTVGVCDGFSGSCTCKQNVVGPNCDQCKDGYWNLTNIPEGCVPCQCCSNGSVNNFCNKVTGGCTCLPNVGSSQDSNCCSCSYGSFSLNTTTGCQTCNCSSHSLSPQCDLTSGQCPCTQGASGRFCELCSSGYARTSMNPADPCQQCNCNNLTLDCDANTAVCIGCTGNTTGPQCNMCQAGYYGDPTRGIPCLPCGCLPLSVNITHTCTLESDGLPTCDLCDVGYTGRRCDQCENGYYGISTLGICVPCDCYSNVDPSLAMTCDSTTGDCLNCTHNTTGLHCELCLPGFYGNITAGVPCKACQCNPNGTVDVCDGFSGSCTCKQNVVGPNCDQCKDGYWNLNKRIEGCLPCQCCSNGSVSNSCNKVTGGCTCLPNVGSSQDSNCCSCSYGSFGLNTTTGCQTCNCSSHSLSPQCDLTIGQCPCTQGASGRFCELCSRGYARTSMNPADPCQQCNCNNLTLDCDANTAVCIGCTGNTTGAYCDTCQPGYYGDPTMGISCLPCGCLPLNVNITHTCTLESDGLPTCDWCDVGYTGRRCDQCENGYYGISTLGVCAPCNCNSNVDPSLGLTCDSTTGVCLNCTNHTTGSHCELCLPGFYGNITSGVPCEACSCGAYSSSLDCDQSTGQCNCTGWAYGRTCDMCPPSYDETNGCELCPACYQLIYQALTLQNMSLSSLKNVTDSALQLFDGYSIYQIEMLVWDINSTLQTCLWPSSLNLTILKENLYSNDSSFLTANNSLTSMIGRYNEIRSDLATSLDMLREAEYFVWNFNRSILSRLYDESVALNKSAVSFYYMAGNCSLSVAELGMNVDALWNGSEVLNMTLAGLLGVLNATYMQAYSYAALLQQLNSSLNELQSNITALMSRAESLTTSLYDLDEMIKNATTNIAHLNASLAEISQTTTSISAGAEVLLGYVEKIGEFIKQASDSSLDAKIASSVLTNEATLIYDDALDLNAAVVTAQHVAQETILSFNMTSDSAQSLLQANIPSWEYAVNLSGLINGSSVPSGDVVALALNASSVKAAANLMLTQALNISSSANNIESVVAGIEPSVNTTTIIILNLQNNISTLQQLLTDLYENMQNATATASAIHHIYIQVTNVLTEVNATIQGLDANYSVYQSELTALLAGILENLNLSQLYWKEMGNVAASFDAQPEMAYNEAVGNKEAAEALLTSAGTLERTVSSPTDEDLQELLSQYLNEMAMIDNLTATSALLQMELEVLTAYFSQAALDLNECYKTP